MVNVDFDLLDKVVDIKESQYDFFIIVVQDMLIYEYIKFLCFIQWGFYVIFDCIVWMCFVLMLGDFLVYNYILFCGVVCMVLLLFRKEKQKVNIDVYSCFRSNNSVVLISMVFFGFGIVYLFNYIV